MLELISTIFKIKSSGTFKRYLDFIQFPHYRNIQSNTKITFNFPLTVFIGQNGCGKSSCLHALYGAVEGKTPFDFWFSTEVDPIAEKPVNAFFYSYKVHGRKKSDAFQVLKSRIRLKNNPDYWETSRPIKRYGMDMKTIVGKERNPPISMSVIYLDFRAELSAFDKYFYFKQPKSGLKKIKNKQDHLRKYSSFLNDLLTGQKTEIIRYNKVQNNLLYNLSGLEIEKISYILGKTYQSGKLITHKLYGEWGYSIQLASNSIEYTEAFSGSGEVAVVRLVTELFKAPESSLILLDEPEVSLHPGAQSRLKLFLLEQIKLKKHQIIITSHSPSIVQGLPREAIKVFYQNPGNGRFLVKENLTPEEAFYHIEFPVDSKKNIIVEDVLAKNIIDGVLKLMGEETANLFNVKFNPGGESVIKREFITVFCREKNINDYVFFDGDQKPKEPHYDWRNFSQTDLNKNSFIKDKIKDQTSEDINFSVDGGHSGGNKEQQVELGKKYLDFYLTNVFYLPKEIPEEIIWDETFAHNQIKMTITNNVDIDSFLDKLDGISGIKGKFALLAEISFGNSNADNIASVHKQFIQRWLNLKNKDFFEIKSTIEAIL